MSIPQQSTVQLGWTREVGQDGKARPTSVEGVQLQRARIRELIEESPNASDRKISRVVGCSPSTVASVRRTLPNLKTGEVWEQEVARSNRVAPNFLNLCCDSTWVNLTVNGRAAKTWDLPRFYHISFGKQLGAAKCLVSESRPPIFCIRPQGRPETQ